MPKRIDLTPFRDLIIESYTAGSDCSQILDILSHRGVQTSERLIRRCLAEWNIKKRNWTEDTPELRIRIADLFYNAALNDEDMLEVLKADGYKIEKRRLARIRKQLGLRRSTRGMDLEALEEDQQRLEAIVKTELDNGVIESYGRNHLYYHFRSLQVLVSRNRLFYTIKRLDPLGVQRRLKRNLRVILLNYVYNSAC
jgi:hypothetical protein